MAVPVDISARMAVHRARDSPHGLFQPYQNNSPAVITASSNQRDDETSGSNIRVIFKSTLKQSQPENFDAQAAETR